MYCFVLYCIVLYCIVLYCSVWFCCVLYCREVYFLGIIFFGSASSQNTFFFEFATVTLPRQTLPGIHMHTVCIQISYVYIHYLCTLYTSIENDYTNTKLPEIAPVSFSF